MKFRSTRLTASVTAAAIGLLGTAGAAQASDASLRSVLKKDVPGIQRSQAKILNGEAAYEKTHSAKALIKALTAQDLNLLALEKKLADQVPSSTDGTKGKKDVLAGLALIVKANNALKLELTKATTHQPVSKAQLAAADKEDVKGNKDLAAGTDLLAKT